MLLNCIHSTSLCNFIIWLGVTATIIIYISYSRGFKSLVGYPGGLNHLESTNSKRNFLHYFPKVKPWMLLLLGGILHLRENFQSSTLSWETSSDFRVILPGVLSRTRKENRYHTLLHISFAQISSNLNGTEYILVEFTDISNLLNSRALKWWTSIRWRNMERFIFETSV